MDQQKIGDHEAVFPAMTEHRANEAGARLRLRDKTANAQAARPLQRRLFDHLFKKLPSIKNLTSAGLYGALYIGSRMPECKRRQKRLSGGSSGFAFAPQDRDFFCILHSKNRDLKPSCIWLKPLSFRASGTTPKQVFAELLQCLGKSAIEGALGFPISRAPVRGCVCSAINLIGGGTAALTGMNPEHHIGGLGAGHTHHIAFQQLCLEYQVRGCIDERNATGRSQTFQARMHPRGAIDGTYCPAAN
ncbi:MAG: hypothetical protein ABI191_00485 [Rhizomicrobium sp.]